MALQVCSESWECKVPAKQMWAGMFEDGHNCLPKALPHLVAAVEYPELPHLLHHHSQQEHHHGWCVPGAVRLIKYHAGDIAHKDIDNTKKFLEKEELLVKDEEKKVDKAFEKEGESLKEEVKKVGEATKDHAKKVGEATKDEVKKVEEEVKKVEEEVKKVEDEVHKVGEKVVGSIEKVEDSIESLLKHRVHFVKEKIEDVEYKALKITVSTIEGFVLGVLMKKFKHTFEFKEKSEGSIIHWSSEFEEQHEHSSKPYEKVKLHFFDIVKHVEHYLLGHNDYAHL